MKLDNVSDLYFVVSVFVPGFIYYSVLSRFVPHRDTLSTESTLLRFLTGTAFTYALCSPILYPLTTGQLFATAPVAHGVTWLGIIFVAPILLALTAARFSQGRIVRKVSEYLGLRSISPIPTGWDWVFGLQEPLFLLVTLTDGTRIAGFYGTESMASSDPDRKDLYLEKVYTVPEIGPWQEATGTRGVYIDGAQIAFIEFKG